ncbi:MAG: Holliday junction branch migration protein RuvA [Thaumarchaeota archaeon]|jgi:Holliday junction DNA helicase RuvA|nr:Holliday junction branch migration protein RuvA [Nitrososphaerota archaeon]|tara:strand:- start:308 stop:892 length:585 start_codon:yes stop_codon:yes gene_type:complete
MIASLEGKLESRSDDSAVINIGGMGFRVYIPTSTLSTLGSIGNEVKLYTHLHLREDNATLYGFVGTEELELFQILINVSGLGPKLALAMLSVMNVEKLTMAIATGSADMLTEIPGIGKKMANRLILELKDKIATGWTTTPATEIAAENIDILAALTSLGYSITEATHATATLPHEQTLSLEEKIKLALKYFGGK